MHVCMYVSQACMHVCIPGMHVSHACIPGMHVSHACVCVYPMRVYMRTHLGLDGAQECREKGQQDHGRVQDVEVCAVDLGDPVRRRRVGRRVGRKEGGDERRRPFWRRWAGWLGRRGRHWWVAADVNLESTAGSATSDTIRYVGERPSDLREG